MNKQFQGQARSENSVWIITLFEWVGAAREGDISICHCMKSIISRVEGRIFLFFCFSGRNYQVLVMTSVQRCVLAIYSQRHETAPYPNELGACVLHDVFQVEHCV